MVPKYSHVVYHPYQNWRKILPLISYMLSSSYFNKCQTSKYWSYFENADFKATPVLWEPYDHVYASVYKKNNWDDEKLYGCKICKGMVRNDAYRKSQSK